MTQKPPIPLLIARKFVQTARGRRRRRTIWRAHPHQTAWGFYCECGNLLTCKTLQCNCWKAEFHCPDWRCQGAPTSRLCDRRSRARQPMGERGGYARCCCTEVSAAVAGGGSENIMQGEGEENKASVKGGQNSGRRGGRGGSDRLNTHSEVPVHLVSVRRLGAL